MILFRAAFAGSTVAAFEVQLESPVGANPGAIRVSVWDVTSLAKTTTNADTGDWLTAGFFHIALTVTTTSWAVYINGASAATGSANLAPAISWLEFMGSADRQYTGSMLNGECGDLAVYGTELLPDRIQAIYLAGTPNPQTVAGGVQKTVTGAQFATDFPATRMERLLAYGGWTGPRSISQSSVTQMAGITDIQGNSAVISASGQVTVSTGGQQAAQAVGNIVFSDAGFMFTDSNGTLCYVSRGDLYVTASKWSLGEAAASVLNSNTDFAGGSLAGWAGFQGSIAASQAQVYLYPWSVLYTPDGVSTSGALEQNGARSPVTALSAYEVTAWVWSAAGWDQVTIGFDWYDASGSYLSTGIAVIAVPAATWTFIDSGSLTAPANAVTAVPRVGEQGTPSSAATLYIQHVTMIPAGAE